MRTKVSLALIVGIFLWLAGMANAQVGIGSYERLQLVAHDRGSLQPNSTIAEA